MVADIYNVMSSADMDTLALFKTNGMSFVKIVNSSGPRQLPYGIPCLVIERPLLKKPLCDLALSRSPQRMRNPSKKASLALVRDQ